MTSHSIQTLLITLLIVFETFLESSTLVATSFSLNHPTLVSRNHSQRKAKVFTQQRKMSTSAEESSSLPDPQSMRIKEIKNELDSMNINYSDCFDKESLCTRLVDARTGVVKGETKKEESSKGSESRKSTSDAPSPAKTSPSNNFDKESKLEELRSSRVKELRTKCAEQNIRWAHMIEKEELVQALIGYYEQASLFSPSGTLTPSKVTAITDDAILDKEINNGGVATTPLLLDVFATW